MRERLAWCGDEYIVWERVEGGVMVRRGYIYIYTYLLRRVSCQPRDDQRAGCEGSRQTHVHKDIAQLRLVARVHDDQPDDGEEHAAADDHAALLEAVAHVHEGEQAARADDEGGHAHERGVDARVPHAAHDERHEVAKGADGERREHVEDDGEQLPPVGHGVHDVALGYAARGRGTVVRGAADVGFHAGDGVGGLGGRQDCGDDEQKGSEHAPRKSKIPHTPCVIEARWKDDYRDDGHEYAQGALDEKKQLPVVHGKVLQLKDSIRNETCKCTSDRVHACEEAETQSERVFGIDCGHVVLRRLGFSET